VTPMATHPTVAKTGLGIFTTWMSFCPQPQ